MYFSQVFNNFAQHAEFRGVFVLDDNNRFLGVITRTELLDWASAKLGTFILRPLTDMDKTIRLVSLINASTAGDVLLPEME